MAQRFSFDNAFLHFACADGPHGFVWKYMLTYVLATVLLVGIGFVLFRPLINIWWDVIMDVSRGMTEAEMEAILVRRMTEIIGWIIFSYILMLLLGLVFWAVFEAAIQRRYVREEGFRLGFGGDELRLLVVGLIWAVFIVVSYILSLILTGLLTGFVFAGLGAGGDNSALLGSGFLASMLTSWLIWAYFAVRLSPAAAITIRDQKIAFFDAWGATRGRFWTLFGAFIVLAILIGIVWMFMYMIIGAGLGASVYANVAEIEQAQDDPVALIGALLTFDIVGTLLAGYVIMIAMQGLVLYVWAGPAALAAKTDPRGGGVAQAADVFA